MSRAERPLQQLVKWRRELEREALGALAAQQNRLAAQEQQLENLREWRRGYAAQETGRSPGQCIRASELGRARAFLASIEHGMKRQEQVVAQSVAEVEGSRARWVRARADLRVAEVMLERRLKEKRKLALQIERREVDEITARGPVNTPDAGRRGPGGWNNE